MWTSKQYEDATPPWIKARNDAIIAAAATAWAIYAYNNGMTVSFDDLSPLAKQLWIEIAEKTVGAFQKQERMIVRNESRAL